MKGEDAVVIYVLETSKYLRREVLGEGEDTSNVL